MDWPSVSQTEITIVTKGERTPQEWAEYCEAAKRDGIYALIEWGRRIYEAKQNLRISFREWAVEYYSTHEYTGLCKLAKIGENREWLSSVVDRYDVSADWTALYQLTTMSEDDVAQIDGTVDQKSIKALKYGHADEGDEWYTPRWLFDSLGIRFSIDVCSPIDRTHNATPAESFYTIHDDGLTKPWHGMIWCNPPYSDADPWARKCINHGNGLLLSHIPANAGWCAEVWQQCDGLRLFQAMEFIRPDGTPQRPGYWLQLAAFGAVARSALAQLTVPPVVTENPRRIPSPMLVRNR